MKRFEVIFAIYALVVAQPAASKECWALTEMKGQTAFSATYTFKADGFSSPMLLCFDTGTGSVSGDDTQLFRFSNSTLAGLAVNKGIELFEVYQIDRENGKVLFTKSRIGTKTVIPGFPNVVGAFIGTATRLPD